jgi:Skp family chaperone for outer membrane proteins
MTDATALRQEIADDQRVVARLKEEIKAIQGFIAADERNIQHSVEAIRTNARLSLDNYRTSLSIKQTELNDLQQELQRKQSVLTKIDEIARKEREVQQLERERDRVINMHERARADLEQLNQALEAMMRPASVQRFSLIMEDGTRIDLPAYDTDMLIGCTDPADKIYPDIDLTPFGGTGSGASRRHATLSLRNGQWTVKDENSTNGTFVNGTRITAHVPRMVGHQTRMRFGAVSGTLTAQDPPQGKTTRLT